MVSAELSTEGWGDHRQCRWPACVKAKGHSDDTREGSGLPRWVLRKMTMELWGKGTISLLFVVRPSERMGQMLGGIFQKGE